jgi:transcription antitermination factor NusG
MCKITPITRDATTQERLSWYAIHTRARHEKRVTRQLEEKGILTYLPMLSEHHDWSDRRKNVSVPLFPCYSFVYMPDCITGRIAVLRTPGVINFVGPRGASSIPDKQIEDIRAALTQNAGCNRHPFLAVGQRVRIRGGALDGIEGVLMALHGSRRLVISVEAIQQSLAICIQGYQIDVLSSPRSSAA